MTGYPRPMLRLSPFLFALALAVPLHARAQTNLFSDMQRFDFSDDGTLLDGTTDSYDGCYGLTVNGVRYTGGAPSTHVDRNLAFPIQSIGGLAVRRVAYVPATGSWGRYLEIIANPTSSSQHVQVDYDCNLGSDGETMVTATSSGDTSLDARDDWFASDDLPDAGDMALGHVLQGPGARTPLRSISLMVDQLMWSFSGDVPPGGVLVIMTFAVQTLHRADSQGLAAHLDTLPPEAMNGLDLYAMSVTNFVVPCAGAACSSDGGIVGGDGGGPIFSRYGCCTVAGVAHVDLRWPALVALALVGVALRRRCRPDLNL